MTSANKQTVERYIDGFNKSDHEQILSCLTDDIVRTVFGAYRLTGKAAYDDEIENPAFTGSPALVITRMVEEDDVVMAELTGEVRRADGELMRVAMGEVFVMRDAKIRGRRLRRRARGERLPLTTFAGRAWPLGRAPWEVGSHRSARPPRRRVPCGSARALSCDPPEPADSSLPRLSDWRACRSGAPGRPRWPR